MATTQAPVARTPPVRHRWLPRQHGGWAMLILPLLLGVAASRFDPWQLVLGGVAVAGYVASATAQAWSRARRPASYRAPLLVWAASFGVLGLVIVVAFPILLASLVILVPASAVVLVGARPGRRRGLVNSLAQVAQALVLVPAAAVVAGEFVLVAVVAATVVAAAYLVGTVLVVRSVLGERDNAAFAVSSVAFHAAVVLLAVLWFPAAYVVLAGWLLARSIALPVLVRRQAGSSRPVRPVHVGLVEVASSIAVVVVSFVVPA